jgi:hypothetical protein
MLRKQLRRKAMNRRLKGKIVEKFGTQWDLAMAIGTHEALVSRVIRGRRTLARWSRKNGHRYSARTRRDFSERRRVVQSLNLRNQRDSIRFPGSVAKMGSDETR